MKISKINLLQRFFEFQERITRKFINLPWFIKIIINIFLFSIFFVIILPLLGIIALVVNFIKQVVKFLKNWRKIFIISKLIILFLVFFIFISSILCLISLVVYISILLLPTYFCWIVLALCLQIILLLFTLSKDHKDKVWEIIKADEMNVNDMKTILINASGDKANKNPILKILEGSYLFVLAGGSFLLSCGSSILIIFTFTLDKLYPELFFKINQNINPSFLNWLIFYSNEFLNVIPIDILSPFIIEFSSYEVLKPWGSIIMIFCQISMVILLYFASFAVFLAYKLKTNIIGKRA